MKKIIQIAILSSLITALNIGCSKSSNSPAPSTPSTPTPTTPTTPAPTANFTYAGEGLAPSTVTFTNSSANASSYSWDFGDNSTSTATNPTHTYRVGGVFTVKLTATGAGGTNSTTKTVNITAPTKYTITKVTIDSIPFTNSNGASWDVGNGPDIYYNITDINAKPLWLMSNSSAYSNLKPANLPWVTVPVSPYQSSDLKQDIGVVVYDYDSAVDIVLELDTKDDVIGAVIFPISTYTSGSNSYPTSVSSSYKGTKITLSLTWQ